MAPFAFLAKPGEYVRDKGTEFWGGIVDGAHKMVDTSLNGWYGFVGELYGTLVDLILHTPEELLSNPEIQRLWMIFVGVSFSFLSALVLGESFRVMFGKSRTNIMSLVSRTAANFLALGFVLPAMTSGLWLINEIVAYFVDIAHNHMDPAKYFGATLAQSFTNGSINFLASVVFLILFLLYIFKILLYYGRRWFDIMVAAIISPLAFTANIFDYTSSYFQKWWANLVNLYLVQVVHAVYVMVLGLIVLTPGEIKNTTDAFFRILLLIGALWRMSDPPSMVGNMADGKTHTMMKSIASKLPLHLLKRRS